MRTSYQRQWQLRAIPLCTALLLWAGGCHEITATLSPHPVHPQAEAAVGRLLSSDQMLAQEGRNEVVILGPGALPELKRQMISSQQVDRVRIVEVAAGIGAPEPLVLQILQKGASDENDSVRRAVAFHAGGFPQLAEQLGPTLLLLAHDSSPAVRAAALSSLATYGGGDGGTVQLPAAELIELTRDPSIFVAAGAASLAVRHPDPTVTLAAREALPRLLKSIKDPQAAHRAAVLIAIGKYGQGAEDAVPTLRTAMARERVPQVKLQAAIALARINTPPARKAALPVLKTFATDADQRLSSAAQSALLTVQTE